MRKIIEQKSLKLQRDSAMKRVKLECSTQSFTNRIFVIRFAEPEGAAHKRRISTDGTQKRFCDPEHKFGVEFDRTSVSKSILIEHPASTLKFGGMAKELQGTIVDTRRLANVCFQQVRYCRHAKVSSKAFNDGRISS